MQLLQRCGIVAAVTFFVIACQTQAPPLPTPYPTYTLYPTYTPYPTFTPYPLPPQNRLPSADIENLVWPTGPRDDVIPSEDAADFIGEHVTVEGTVVRTHNSGNAVFLNFGQGFDNAFVAVIFPDDWNKFPKPPEDLFYGRLVRVEGVIEEYQGTPEIIVKDPWQIEIALTLGESVASNCECEAQAAEQVVVTATPDPVQLPTATILPSESKSAEAADDSKVLTDTTVSGTVTPTIPEEQIQQTEQIISWQDAAGYAGQTATVAGQVVDTYNSGKVVFLNFDADYRNTFKVAIFPDAWPLFPAAPEDYYKDKTVQVTGQIKMYQNAPEIIVDHPDQIEIVEQ